MKLRTSLTSFRVALFGALGLVPSAACSLDGDASSTRARLAPSCTPKDLPGARTGDGFEFCNDGYFYHRRERLACSDLAAVVCATPSDTGGCKTNVDCNAGRCVQDAPAHCLCAQGCNRDEECGVGAVCDCRTHDDSDESGAFGTCVPAQRAGCTVDADCGPGGVCAAYNQTDGCGSFRGFACLSPLDECHSSHDCESGTVCNFDGDHRVCVKDNDCNVGRPFRVEGENRVAPLAARADWSRAPAEHDGVAALPEGLRAELGAYWASLGQMEHASVAAFARFALQLLALGAPPELVAGAQAAMGDELEHARLCFGLASEISGRPVGPGPLGLEGALEGSSLAEVVRLAVIEGCVGETVAALEAAESHECATSPAVRTVLGRVRGDETRHAELAWRFVGWALEVGGVGVREAACEAFARAFDEAEASEGGGAGEPGEAEGPALAFGRLPERVRRELRRRALREVVAPCAERLLASAPAQRPGTGRASQLTARSSRS